jgi:hypothetical protein
MFFFGLYFIKNGCRKIFETINNYICRTWYMPRGMKKGLNTQKFDRCVSKVKSRSGKKANPYAVCNSTMSGKSKGRSKNFRKTGSKK